MASVTQSNMYITTCSQTHTQSQTGTHTCVDLPSTPARAPLETQSVRLQLNLKVKGGYENVSTVYPGDFLKIILRLFTIWPRHGDQLWVGLLRACSPERARSVLWNIVTCGLACVMNSPQWEEWKWFGSFILGPILRYLDEPLCYFSSD